MDLLTITLISVGLTIVLVPVIIKAIMNNLTYILN